VTKLTKHHGLGNDFLVALAADNPGIEPDPELAVHLCDRRRGMGADGLIYGLDPQDPAHDCEMVLLNSDGSAAEISGNGIRCLGQAILRRRAGAAAAGAGSAPGAATGSGEVAELAIETPGGVRSFVVTGGDVASELWSDVDMGEVSPGPEPSAATLAYPAAMTATLDVGNPHLVLLVDDPWSVDLEVDGPALEAGYPDGINVHFVRAPGPHALDLAVWERGSGVTEACGSGATAAVAAATAWGIVDGTVAVTMPGGRAEVEVIDGRAHLRGPSVYVGEVMVP
jgi:diaminopimelate epimerase